MPGLAAEKAVRSAAHFLATVEGALVLDAMEEITHHGRVIRPAFGGRSDLVVAMQETDPVAVGIASRQTDQFGAEAGDDDAEAGFFVGEDVEEAVGSLFFVAGVGAHLSVAQPSWLWGRQASCLSFVRNNGQDARWPHRLEACATWITGRGRG